MYQVIDSRTGYIMGTFKLLARATAKADRLDNEHGAVRYIVRRMAD